MYLMLIKDLSLRTVNKAYNTLIKILRYSVFLITLSLTPHDVTCVACTASRREGDVNTMFSRHDLVLAPVVVKVLNQCVYHSYP